MFWVDRMRGSRPSCDWLAGAFNEPIEAVTGRTRERGVGRSYSSPSMAISCSASHPPGCKCATDPAGPPPRRPKQRTRVFRRGSGTGMGAARSRFAGSIGPRAVTYLSPSSSGPSPPLIAFAETLKLQTHTAPARLQTKRLAIVDWSRGGLITSRRSHVFYSSIIPQACIPPHRRRATRYSRNLPT